MPSVWSPKDERQFEHIRSNGLANGQTEDTAEEIAARTVNKRRRKEGRTMNKSTMGTGNPNLDLEERTLDELRNIATELQIYGRSRMRKSEIIRAIRNQRS